MLIATRFWIFWLAGSFLAAPFYTMQGSNAARTLAGVFALLGAMSAIPRSFATFAPEPSIFGIACLVLSPLLCWLVNIFLINKDVQAYVSQLRAGKGLSADHWKID